MVDQYDRWIPDWPGQQPYDDPQYVRWMQQHRGMQGQQPAQATAPQMTPTIDARMIQVASIAEAEGYQLQPGASQMFYTADRSAFVIKEQGQGGYNLMIYDRRPPEPPKPALDPSQYVTWDALDAHLAQIINRGQQQQRPTGGAE